MVGSMKQAITRVGWRIGLAVSAGLSVAVPAWAQTAPQPAAPTTSQPKTEQMTPAPGQTSAPQVPAKPAPAATAAQHPAPPPAKPEEEHLKDATSLLGQDVHTPDGQLIGRIEDVLVDATGHPRAVVVDFGGFMGIGSRKVAVAWDKMHFPPQDAKNQKITCDLTPQQIKVAPEYKEGKKPVTVTGAPPKQPATPAPQAPAQAGPTQPAPVPPTPAPPVPAPGPAASPPASPQAQTSDQAPAGTSPPGPSPSVPPASAPAPAANGASKP